MGSIAGFITAVSLSLIIAGIFSMITPESSTRKVFNTLLCLFLLIAVLAPVSSGFNLQLELEEPDESTVSGHLDDLNATIEKQLAQTAADRVGEQVEQILTREEISSAKFQIIMDTNEDSRIQISQVDIYIPEGDIHKKDTIKREIENQLGLTAQVFAS